MLEEMKEGAKQTVSETMVNKWKGCLLNNIRKEDKWLPFIAPTYNWSQKKVINRGKDAAASALIDLM